MAENGNGNTVLAHEQFACFGYALRNGKNGSGNGQGTNGHSQVRTIEAVGGLESRFEQLQAAHPVLVVLKTSGETNVRCPYYEADGNCGITPKTEYRIPCPYK